MRVRSLAIWVKKHIFANNLVTYSTCLPNNGGCFKLESNNMGNLATEEPGQVKGHDVSSIRLVLPTTGDEV
ncbi:hypothetical protein SLEP1_g53744 [Rubroshorea leprosula]|uniref:Uncharacterized protein n=1 Tax=Rubroshorea leprosula TaxID=152421 RepID=A0AAV5MAG6_9ROSI|nr:hypothetical protein SLEP1_g53744 [Rubroshorea leprosula]